MDQGRKKTKSISGSQGRRCFKKIVANALMIKENTKIFLGTQQQEMAGGIDKNNLIRYWREKPLSSVLKTVQSEENSKSRYDFI